ncbi:TPA_asm: protein 3 [Brassica rapa virus 1]|uniref:Protein 3 n=1 Tax=Brassica rapa virus 1 TaxID=2793725 RepID=A0A8D9PH11_9RHAB|nr:protein 3 [Brassica rapa virus 1]DAF42359.1 TPA_asm: protein 3 [Brassica rapa virus 1]
MALISREPIELFFSTHEKIISNLSKCLKPYAYLAIREDKNILDCDRIGESIGKIVSSATSNLNKEFSNIALFSCCSFCDTTKRETKECVCLSLFKAIVEDPRVQLLHNNEITEVQFLGDDESPICISCIKTVIFNRDPLKKLKYLVLNRVPKILQPDDLSTEIFNNEDYSFYYDSFNDYV